MFATNLVCFNAHRIFTPELIIKTFDELSLASFSVISTLENKSGFFENISLEKFHEIDFGTCHSGGVVGLFEFVKNAKK